MVITAHDMKQAGIDIPILVGGAALSRKFTDTKISNEYEGLVLYAKDAMNGLDLANQVQNPEDFDKLVQEKETKRNSLAPSPAQVSKSTVATAVKVVSSVRTDVPVYVPKDTDRHIVKSYTMDHVEPYINKQMLIGHHLGVKGNIEKLLAAGDEKTVKINDMVNQLIVDAKKNNWIKPQAVYQFFPAQSDGNKVIIYDPKEPKKVLQEFDFPRQAVGAHLCLSDFVKTVDSGLTDYVGFFAVTAGPGVREIAENLKEQGRFLECHALQALALETAEGLAELIHRQMRDRWGFPDPVDFTMKDRFSAKYQGQRFSFGYPACPELDDQEKLFSLIQPEDIGVNLTEGFMMEPEASVSAMVFAHPDARYFTVLRNE